jgi:hypothetical protein
LFPPDPVEEIHRLFRGESPDLGSCKLELPSTRNGFSCVFEHKETNVVVGSTIIGWWFLQEGNACRHITCHTRVHSRLEPSPRHLVHPCLGHTGPFTRLLPPPHRGQVKRMSTSSASRQPVRATPSLTLARGPPALAPADKTYTPLIRTALAHRVQTNVLFPCVLFCWALSCVLSSNIFSLGGTTKTGTKQGYGIKRALLSPFRLQTLGITIVLFLVLVLPVLVLRKSTIDVAPARQSSPQNTFRAVIKSKEVKKAGLTYTGSMILMLGLHYLLAYVGYVAGQAEDPKIAVFGRSK